MYKSRLQELCQQKLRRLPEYAVAKVGHDHNPRFRASVTVDGLTFDGRDCFKSFQGGPERGRQARLPPLSVGHPIQESAPDVCPKKKHGSPNEDSGFYKNLLQQFTQKEGYSMPVYKTRSIGESHMPTFSSTVEVEGETLDGEGAKTKKLAEANAAKVAWTTLEQTTGEGDDNLLSE
ncbi:Double-stranded RNA-binding protein 5 [Acorus calamus]|uniref:Double-stranded RNA-binding protein 5 n=1 Tax=Acorus calamus TaxID=4465 RepID=A0AAV9EKV6_ACOCL|nr:Double-stranded RNA-binding protein 5 [Acorus calamus]